MAKAGLSKAMQSALARPVLNRLASIPVFQQGQEMFLHEKVQGLKLAPDEAAGEVADGGTFTVRLWMEDGFLQYECSCEAGQQGYFCNHTVATALAAVDGVSVRAKAKPKAKTIDMAETDKVLREQSTDTLVGLLLNWAQKDDGLRQHLLTFAAQQGGYALDLRSYRALMKKRLRRPPWGANMPEYRQYVKLLDVELEQTEALIGFGQALTALELCSDLVVLLFTFAGDERAGADLVLDRIPKAFGIFVRAARQARAEPKVIIPHLLKFYRFDLEAELEDEHLPDRLPALYELLGPAGRRELAQAAEGEIRLDKQDWTRRMISTRMLRLAQSIYAQDQDYDNLERTFLAHESEEFDESLDYARLMLKAGQPQRALKFLDSLKLRRRAKASTTGDEKDFYWLLAECRLQTGEVLAAFVDVAPILREHQAPDFDTLQVLAERHQCWPQWREYLLADDPPGRPAPLHRHHWRFLVFMREKNYEAAWPHAVLQPMNPRLAAVCAAEMRHQDPANAARVLMDASVSLLQFSPTANSALAYLDMVCLLVIEREVRPQPLLDLLHSTIRRYQIWGSAALVPHLPLWNKTIGLLSGRSPSPARGPAGRAR